jgi:hypothetical protein
MLYRRAVFWFLAACHTISHTNEEKNTATTLTSAFVTRPETIALTFTV